MSDVLGTWLDWVPPLHVVRGPRTENREPSTWALFGCISTIKTGACGQPAARYICRGNPKTPTSTLHISYGKRGTPFDPANYCFICLRPQEQRPDHDRSISSLEVVAL